MSSNKVIIDCDAGVDDCQALFVALSAHCRGIVKIVAITTVSGNVHVDSVIQNVKRCLAIKAIEQAAAAFPHVSIPNQDVLRIPVYYGATEPLVVDVEEDTKHAKFWHGNDGCGGAAAAVDQSITHATTPAVSKQLLDPRPTETIPAAIKIADLCLASPGEIKIVAIGPLTNIALAYKLYGPLFASAVKEVLFMGGTLFGRGNANLTAEFNAFADPEALQICLHRFGGKITMVGWDLTAKCGVPFEWVHRHWFGSGEGGDSGNSGNSGGAESSVSSFLALISAEIVHKSRRGPWKECGLLIPDPLAMCVAIDASVAVEAKDYFATVELNGKRTRGMVVVDYDSLFVKEGSSGAEGAEDEDGKRKLKKNLKVVTALDMDQIKAMLKESTTPPTAR